MKMARVCRHGLLNSMRTKHTVSSGPLCTHMATQSARRVPTRRRIRAARVARSAGLSGYLIGSPINFADRLAGSLRPLRLTLRAAEAAAAALAALARALIALHYSTRALRY